MTVELPGPTIDAGTRRPQSQPAATMASAEFELGGGTFEIGTPPADQSDRTLELDSHEDPRVSQTIQSDEFSVADLPSGAGNDRTIAIDSQDDPNLSQTIQSEEFSAPQADRTIALSMDTSSGKRDVAPPAGANLDRTMETVWAESARGDVQENMTIKGAESDAPSGPT
ncbi:MAG: hypothetical protein NT069_30070, partial [Planctomycetota bacterium]|nr:hypothetical protein [Planctomycetota bacterium]